ncbi:MAG: hypothetical protein ACLURP_09720 [Ruminococcus sp.]
MFNLGEAILALLEIVFGFWNNQVSLVFELLGQSHRVQRRQALGRSLKGLNPFLLIGSALVVLFSSLGFCAESVDIREEIRFEAILRMFIRVAIARWLVSYNITIMKALFTSCGNAVAGHLGQNQSVELSIDPAQAEVIKDLGFGTSIVFLILAVFLSLIVIICGFFLLYNVYFRFLKIMVIVPLGRLPAVPWLETGA